MASSPTPNPLKRKRESCRRSRIVIEIPAKPRCYVPGSGPQVQRIGLLPARDSTASILERILLPSPGYAADGKPLPKRMTYLVGWRDLPAACMLVPAMQILDYVSPHALEEWEYQMELEMDEERARMEEEKAQEKPKEKEKRGRPPAHSQIEAAAVAGPDSEVLKTGRPKSGAMSLTTPSKKRLQDFEGLSDVDTSPSRQLEQESLEVFTRDNTIEPEQGQLASSKLNSEEPSEGLASQQHTDSDSSKKSNKIRKSRSAKPSTLKARLLATTKPKSASSRETTPKPWSILTNSVLKKETPVPLPIIPGFMSAPTSTPTPTNKRPPSFTPLGRSTPVSALKFETPTHEVETPSRTQTPKSKAKPQTKDSVKKPKKATKKETVPKEAPAQPPTQTAQDDLDSLDEDTDPVWEVKRVEASETYEVEGVGLVRYFKVRWEGDWPPEQNPSWEPESNLAPALVRNYMKEIKRKPTPRKKQPVLKQTTLPWAPAKQYKSVSEAFAGDEDELGLPGTSMNGGAADDAASSMFDQPEEFLVVEEPPAKKHRKQGVPGWDGNRASTDLEFSTVSSL